MIRIDYIKDMAQLPVYEVQESLERKDIDSIVCHLLENSVLLYGEGKDGDTCEDVQFCGCRIRQAYLLKIHPALVQEVVDVAGFIGVKYYPSRKHVLPYEIGLIGNLRIIVDASLEKFVVPAVPHEHETFISIAGGFGQGDLRHEDYLVVKSK